MRRGDERRATGEALLGAAIRTSLAALLYRAWGWSTVRAMGAATGAAMIVPQWFWPVRGRTPASMADSLETAADGAEVT